jgi:homoserine O-acetyltransferase/O-succinyltransferase
MTRWRSTTSAARKRPRVEADVDYRVAELGDLALQGGAVLRNARLAYKTFGALDSSRSNAIVYPTSFGTRHTDLEWLVGRGQALDPDRYFIVMPNLFGNGLSSSPSHLGYGPAAADFPLITMYDNVVAQHRLITEVLAIRRIKLAVGFSMGAQAAFHWGALFSSEVERIAPICGSARTSRHNFVFLEGVKAALTGDRAWRDGVFETPAREGLRAMGRVYAGWALSHAFYREEVYLKLGFASLDDFLVRDWEARFADQDGNDLVSMIWTWQHADISANELFGGDLTQALGAIGSHALIMPSQTDLYFPVEDNRREVALLPNASLIPIPTIWGHRVNNPWQNPADAAFVNDALQQFLSKADGC